MSPPLIGDNLSVTYIGPNSRIERPRKTKIGIEVAHVTRDSDTTFKIKRSRSPGRFAHRRVCASGSWSGGRENVFAHRQLLLSWRLLGGRRHFGAHGERGAGHNVAAACLQLVNYKLF